MREEEQSPVSMHFHQRRLDIACSIHKGSNLGTGLRKLAGTCSSVITYRSSSQPDPRPKLNRISENTSLVGLIGSGM